MNNRRFLLLFGLFAAAAITRIYLASFPGFEIDLLIYGRWAERLAEAGPLGAYDGTIPLHEGLPPGYLYILWGIGIFREALAPDLALDGALFLIFLKVPANTFDILTGVIIFKILEKRVSFNIGLIGAAFYLFNPAIFYNSAVWGQNDAVFTFFLLFSIYLLLEGRPELASLSAALAVLADEQAISFIPVFAVSLLLRAPPKRIALSAAVGFATLFFLALPFFWDDPVFGLPRYLSDRQGAFTHASLNAFNLWWIIRGEQSDLAPLALSLSAETWGLLLWLGAQLLIAFWLFRRRKDDWSFYWAASLAVFSFFILPTRIHERYLFPFFSFFLVSALLSRYAAALLAVYGFLSALNFLNVYFPMVRYYNDLTLEPFRSWSSRRLLISYGQVSSFFALLIVSLLLLIPFGTIKRRFSIGFG
jgi:Gpi18-like mannosyltransferase